MPIQVNLEGPVNLITAGIKRAYGFMGYAVNATAHSDDIRFELPFINDPDIIPIELGLGEMTPTLYQDYKETFVQWVIGNGLRELVEVFALFLDQVYKCILHTAPEEPNGETETALSKFERGNIKQKLDKLKDFGLESQFISATDFETLNVARNCLTHRAGIVGHGAQSKNDFNGEGNTLRVAWKAVVAFLNLPDGTRAPWKQGELKDHYPAGTKLSFEVITRTKITTAGERIKLEPFELAEICFNFLHAADELYKQLQALLKERNVEILSAPPIIPNNEVVGMWQ